MSKIPVLPADTYIVVNRTILDDHDRKLLIMLYQPIVGATAINLYFTLWSYLDKAEILSCVWTHHHLINSMGTNMTEFMEAREKLEGIGLLKTYFKKDYINNFVYELYSPVSAYEFFNNPILNTVLYTNIGSTEYEKVKEYFKVPKMNLSEYTDISLKFSEVYQTSRLELKPSFEIKKRNTQKLNIKTKIDLENILSSIPEEMILQNSITKEMKDYILKLVFIYDLEEKEITDLLKDSIDEKHHIDREKLRHNARNYYQFENNGKLPSIAYQNQPESLRNKSLDSSKRSQVIYQFETISPHDFLCSKYKDGNLSRSDRLILEYLLIDLNLKPGVVNVLLDYVLKINENKLTRAFVEVIAGQWKRNGITTVEEAMQQAEKEYKKRKEKPKEKKKEEKPSWFDKEVTEEIDEAKQKELEELLKEFR